MIPNDLAGIKIIYYPDPRLRKICASIHTFDDALARLAEHMLELMHAAQGIGLAAPQVGVLGRLFVCNVTGDRADDMIFVNPVLDAMEGNVEGEEGCLSIPEVTVNVQRALSCTLKGYDLNGRAIEKAGAELLSRCWQHECDHLEGRLITDRMSEADAIANRRALKSLEARYKNH